MYGYDKYMYDLKRSSPISKKPISREELMRRTYRKSVDDMIASSNKRREEVSLQKRVECCFEHFTLEDLEEGSDELELT